MSLPPRLGRSGGRDVERLTTRPHLSHPKYRPDIDGLRAVAVLSVVTFHAFPEWMKGGFIGVDVFFVISGFLISTIIFENLERGTFTFSDFYARRIRRIFPALLVVLVACYGVGWFALLADEYKQLGKHIAAGAGFVANLVLWNEAGYFDNSAETKPLLHLWSLGVEEQFYIVWPLALWLAWRSKFNLLALTVLCALVSFSLSAMGIKQDPVATFYSPHTRLWELLSGSLLAWIAVYRREPSGNAGWQLEAWLGKASARGRPSSGGRALPDTLSICGSLLLAYGFWRIHKNLGFPGKWALVPVLGSALIVLAGPRAWINSRILSHRLAVGLGLISFPLYLWHWPLLTFARIVESEVPSREIRMAAVLSSIALGWLTFKFVERPIRTGRHGNVTAAVLLAGMAVAGYLGYDAYGRDGLKFRPAQTAVHTNRFDIPYKGSCEELTGEFFSDDWCNVGTASVAPATTVMIGDSFANAFSPMLAAFSKRDAHFSFAQFGRGQCPTLLEYGPPYCRLIANRSFEYVRGSPHVRTVVLAANWPAYYAGKDFYWVNHTETQASFKHALEKTIGMYRDIGKDVAVFLAPPVGADPKSCILRPLRLTQKNSCNLTLERARRFDGDYRAYLLPAMARLAVATFDPFEFFCNDSECKIAENARIFSADGGHLSVFGGEYLADKGHDVLRHILLQSAE